MNHQLMAEEVEVDPVLAGAPLLQAEHVSVEMPGSGQVEYRNGQVKRCQCHQVKPLRIVERLEFSLAAGDEKTIVFAPSSNNFDELRRPCCVN